MNIVQRKLSGVVYRIGGNPLHGGTDPRSMATFVETYPYNRFITISDAYARCNVLYDDLPELIEILQEALKEQS